MTPPTFDWTTVTEVQLSHGKHKRATEGLCLMEMVAWFAGEKHSDRPKCACFVLGRFGIRLNDLLPDGLRDQLLKPLVPLIAGTRGDADDEGRRATKLLLWVVNRMIAPLVAGFGMEEAGRACAAVSASEECFPALALCRKPQLLANIPGAGWAQALAHTLLLPAEYLPGTMGRLNAALDLAEVCLRFDRGMATAVPIAVEGLRQAILAGPHEGFVTADLPSRHVALRQLVTA